MGIFSAGKNRAGGGLRAAPLSRGPWHILGTGSARHVTQAAGMWASSRTPCPSCCSQRESHVSRLFYHFSLDGSSSREEREVRETPQLIAHRRRGRARGPTSERPALRAGRRSTFPHGLRFPDTPSRQDTRAWGQGCPWFCDPRPVCAQPAQIAWRLPSAT